MILRDFECPNCGVFEDLVSSNDTSTVCSSCGSTSLKVMSAVYVCSMNDPVKRVEALKKRSLAHSIKEMKSTPEKITSKFGGKATPKVQNPWNVRRK